MQRSKYFWFGIGVAGLAWAWRRQLRPLAVKGAKGGLLVLEGVKENIHTLRDVFFDLKQDAQLERIRQEIKSDAGTTVQTKGDEG